MGSSLVATASTNAIDASAVRRRASQYAEAVIHSAPSASMCPLWATSNTTSGFHAYASASHSLLPVNASQRHYTSIV